MKTVVSELGLPGPGAEEWRAPVKSGSPIGVQSISSGYLAGVRMRLSEMACNADKASGRGTSMRLSGLAVPKVLDIESSTMLKIG